MHHHGPDDTIRAMSYLRFINAQQMDVMVLPSMGRSYDLCKTPIPPISCANEILVLQMMARLMREQLAKCVHAAALKECVEQRRCCLQQKDRYCLVLSQNERLFLHHKATSRRRCRVYA